MTLFDYESASELLLSGSAVATFDDAARYLNQTFPADFYSANKQISFASWMPWPGKEGNFIPDNEFYQYCNLQSVERAPSITSFHGHQMVMPTIRVEYLGRSKKSLKCKVTFVRRYWDEEKQRTVEEDWRTVPAYQGENNHIHLMECLPGEDELKLDQSQFFTETPEDIDRDFDNRMKFLGGHVLNELL